MRRLYLLIALPCLIAFTGCSDKITFAPESDLVVIRGYLQAGKPIRDIQVSYTLGLGSLDTIAPGVEDAQVQLIKNDTCYLLDEYWSRDGSYYYSPVTCPEGDCPEVDLTVETWDIFKIEVIFFDKVATGETVVPAPPGNLSISSDKLIIPESSASGPGSVTLSWESAAGAMFFVKIENLEAAPQPVDPSLAQEPPTDIISPPFTGNRYAIYWRDLTHLGKHRVTVYSINHEYADMYESREQDTRDLNEPKTNIKNGLGIFTAFNSDYILFDAERK